MTPEDTNRLDGPTLADVAEDYRPRMSPLVLLGWVVIACISGFGIGWGITMVWRWIGG